MTSNLLIIPHYNNRLGLENSIKSIGADEVVDVLIIDDGSTKSVIDESSVLINKKFNGNIIFKYFEENKGIEFALNFGLKYGLEKDYKYISRLDCGDICKNNRFKIQEEYLELNNDIAIVGSNVDAMNSDGDYLYTIKVPEDDKSIRKGMLHNAMFIHPSIMFRAKIINDCGFYPTNYKAAEDFAFFTNILKKYKGANINESLVKIEININGISFKKRRIQTKSRINILKDNYTFGLRSSYGLLRSYILHYMPNSLIQIIKKTTYK